MATFVLHPGRIRAWPNVYFPTTSPSPTRERNFTGEHWYAWRTQCSNAETTVVGSGSTKRPNAFPFVSTSSMPDVWAIDPLTVLACIHENLRVSAKIESSEHNAMACRSSGTKIYENLDFFPKQSWVPVFLVLISLNAHLWHNSWKVFNQHFWLSLPSGWPCEVFMQAPHFIQSFLNALFTGMCLISNIYLRPETWKDQCN